MENALIDLAKGATYEDVRTTATSGATITNAVRFAWDDTLTREEVIKLLDNIRAGFLSPDKVPEVA